MSPVSLSGLRVCTCQCTAFCSGGLCFYFKGQGFYDSGCLKGQLFSEQSRPMKSCSADVTGVWLHLRSSWRRAAPGGSLGLGLCDLTSQVTLGHRTCSSVPPGWLCVYFLTHTNTSLLQLTSFIRLEPIPCTFPIVLAVGAGRGGAGLPSSSYHSAVAAVRGPAAPHQQSACSCPRWYRAQ